MKHKTSLFVASLLLLGLSSTAAAGGRPSYGIVISDRPPAVIYVNPAQPGHHGHPRDYYGHHHRHYRPGIARRQGGYQQGYRHGYHSGYRQGLRNGHRHGHRAGHHHHRSDRHRGLVLRYR